jgi:hypothetical protein
MQLRAFLFFIVIVFSSTLVAQSLTGVWEGSFLLNGSKKQKMSVRVELIETDGEYVGIVSSRGFDKNTSFGCDYLVGGRMYDGKISLIRKEVRRGVAMSKTDCAFFEELYLTLPKNGAVTQLTGRWYWRGDAFDAFTAVKTDSVISEFTKDEIGDYIQELYKQFEEQNILLKPENRLYQKVDEVDIDGSDIVLEFTSIDKSVHDSISVLYNGDIVATDRDLTKRPLMIRLKEPVSGMNDIIVISQSIAQNKLKIRLLVKQQGKEYTYILEPGFIRNSLLLLNRKQN